MRHCTNSLILWIVSAGCLFATAGARAEDKPDLAGILKSNAPWPEKRWACWELKRVGTAQDVPALAALLTDKDLSHAARYALETMPCPEAAAALRQALGTAAGLVKAGIIDTIGQRRDPEAVALLIPLLQDADVQVAGSAAVALGKIGTPEAAKALGAALGQAGSKIRPQIAEGCLLCAQGLLRAGKAEEASKIYQELAKLQGDRAIRHAALQGTIRVAAASKNEVIFQYLAGTDVDAREAAAGEIGSLGENDLKTLAARLTKLPVASQASVLAALRIRHDKSFMPIAMELTRCSNAEVRTASIKALGQLGDASAVQVLVDAMFADPLSDGAARRSLEAIYAMGADEVIITIMQGEKDPARRARLIDLLDARKAVSAVPALLQEATSDNAEIRGRAISALGHLAEPKDVPGMIRALLKSENGPERDNAEKAITLVYRQIPQVEKRAEPVLAAMANATEVQRAALLPMLGRTGAPKALEVIQAALAGDNAQLREAGVRALANWPNASVADQLLKLAQSEADPQCRTWALRGFIRIVSRPSKTPAVEKLALLRQAMKLSTRGEERGLVLERAGAVRAVETLRFVVPYLDQPELAPQACFAVVELAHHREVRQPNKAEFEAALKKVLVISKDATILDRAKRYLQGI